MTSQSSDKDKRALARGGSDAAPPRSKAKAKTDKNESEQEMLTDDEEFSMKDLFKMVKRIDQRTSKIDALNKELKQFKEEVKQELVVIKDAAKADNTSIQAKISKIDGDLEAMNKRVSYIESRSSSSTTPWSPSKPPSQPQGTSSATASTAASRVISPDELVVTGFERGTHRKTRVAVTEKLLAKLPISGSHFTILPKLLHSNLSFLLRKERAPQAVVSQLLEEFRADPALGHIEHEGKVYEVQVRKPVPPARLKRNAILGQACRFIEANRTNKEGDIDICWQTGSVKWNARSVFSVDFEGGKAYFEKLLDLGLTKDQLEKAVASPAPTAAKRL